MSNRNYKSSYGGGDITAAQYVTEKVFAKFASGDLPDKFWTLPQHKKNWSRYAKEVHTLLKTYSPEAIVRGLEDYRLRRLTSVHAKAAFMWKPVFDFYQKKLDAKKPSKPIDKGVSGSGRKSHKKSKLGGLNE